jgi:hypothetical protein
VSVPASAGVLGDLPVVESDALDLGHEIHGVLRGVVAPAAASLVEAWRGKRRHRLHQ